MENEFSDFDYDNFAKEREKIETNKYDREKYENVDDNMERDDMNDLLEDDRNEEETTLMEPEMSDEPDLEWDKIDDEIDLDSIPNPQKDLADQRRIETYEKKNFLMNFLEHNVVKRDGVNSKELVEKFNVRLDKKGKVIGGKFENKNIIVLVNGKFFYSRNKNLQESINRFKELSRKARAEHYGTFSAQVEENIALQDMDSNRLEEITSQVSKDSLESLNDNLESYIDSLETTVKDISFRNDEPSPNELLRTIKGYLDMPESQTVEEKLENLENEADHWRLKKITRNRPRKRSCI